MKYLIMTEGSCEKALLDACLEKGMLSIPLSDLLYEQIFHARQIDNRLSDMIGQLPFGEKVRIIRVGDKLTDQLVIDEDLADRIVATEKICIKPEFEILHIIYRGKFSEFLKNKSGMKPCEFLCSIDGDYRKSYKANFAFFADLENEELFALAEEYCRLRGKTHKKDEGTLISLLRKDKKQ